MASVEAATGLLTAESIVIAGLAVSLRALDPSEMTSTDRKFAQFTTLTMIFLTGVSFICSLSYLHLAAYPDTWLFGTHSPRTYFAIAITTLAFAVQLGLIGLAIMTKPDLFIRLLDGRQS